MTENTAPQPDLNNEPEIDPEPGWSPIDIVAEEEAARENFTLASLFGGPPREGALPKKTQLIFLKPELVERYETMRPFVESKRRILELGEEPEKPKRTASADEKAAYKEKISEYNEARAALEAEVERDEAELEEARTEMLKHALAFHMRAYPQVALKVARREMRSMFIDPQTKKIREGYDNDDVEEWLYQRLFGETVIEVKRSDGTVVDFGVPKAQLGEMLATATNMHPGVWSALKEAYDELMSIAGIRQAAVEDAGF